MLIAEWKPKGRLYLLELQTDKRNKSAISVPTWVRDDKTLVQWVKDRITDKSLPSADELMILKPMKNEIHKLV